ncbi:MAG: ABC transporter permease, partial [Clostridia bacterium]
MKLAATAPGTHKESYLRALGKNIVKHKYAYLMMLPVMAFYIIFHYAPMYGAIIAFKDYSPTMGILGSPWVGLKHFISFFTGMYFTRLLRNTLLISFYGLLFGFTAPILFALLLNELRSNRYKRVLQTVSYFPHFISMVVICGLIKTFTLSDGIINDLIVLLGGERSSLLQKPELFRPIFIISGIWQNLGWDSVIYLAALAGIDTQLYEACEVDGGRKFAKMWHITLPGIMPTIVIMFIMRIGQL